MPEIRKHSSGLFMFPKSTKLSQGGYQIQVYWPEWTIKYLEGYYELHCDLATGFRGVIDNQEEKFRAFGFKIFGFGLGLGKHWPQLWTKSDGMSMSTVDGVNSVLHKFFPEILDSKVSGEMGTVSIDVSVPRWRALWWKIYTQGRDNLIMRMYRFFGEEGHGIVGTRYLIAVVPHIERQK